MRIVASLREIYDHENVFCTQLFYVDRVDRYILAGGLKGKIMQPETVMKPGFTLDPSILRAYDIRGVIGDGITEQACYAVGRAFGTIVMRRITGTSVVVGYDGRETSPQFAAAIRQGLSDCGLNIYDIGMGPTPMTYFGLKELDADAAVMITGSHSPVEHNGIKMALRTGPFYGDDVQEIGRLVQNSDFETGQGRVEVIDIKDKYIKRLLSDLDMKKPLKVAWDAGNGAAGAVLRTFTDQLPGAHYIIYEEVDGTFPNHHPDPTVEKNLVDLQNCVLDNECDLGIGFDGDADRIGIVGAAGEIYWADTLMAMYAAEVLETHPGAPIIADVKSSRVLFDEIERLGGKPVMVQTGHSILKDNMNKMCAPLGGELSGHICFADKYYGFDDGLYCAVRLLNILSRSDDGFVSLTKHLPQMCSTPEVRIHVDADRKFDIPLEIASMLAEVQGITVNDMDGIRVTSQDGWWLLRASNTESVLSLRAESFTEEGLETLKAQLEGYLQTAGVDFKFDLPQ